MLIIKNKNKGSVISSYQMYEYLDYENKSNDSKINVQCFFWRDNVFGIDEIG
jgi:hypothetical protein